MLHFGFKIAVIFAYLFIDPPDSKPESGLSSKFSILLFLRDRLRIMFSMGEAILFILCYLIRYFFSWHFVVWFLNNLNWQYSSMQYRMYISLHKGMLNINMLQVKELEGTATNSK